MHLCLVSVTWLVAIWPPTTQRVFWLSGCPMVDSSNTHGSAGLMWLHCENWRVGCQDYRDRKKCELRCSSGEEERDENNKERRGDWLVALCLCLAWNMIREVFKHTGRQQQVGDLFSSQGVRQLLERGRLFIQVLFWKQGVDQSHLSEQHMMWIIYSYKMSRQSVTEPGKRYLQAWGTELALAAVWLHDL